MAIGDSMTETLHLKLLGKPQVTLGETPLTKFGTAKAEALLYYLTVTGHSHSREAVVDLLWGEMPESKAKRNLTTILSTLRKVIEPYLLIEPHHIAFNSDAPHWLDITHFQDTIQSIDEDTETETLRQAVDLYHGDFLEGVYVKNGLVFEEWLLAQRERLRELMLEGLDVLVAHYINRAEYNTGISYATRLLELDPWRESAHRQMMSLLARSGQRSAALAQYETCRQILGEELGVEPMAETTALYERLKGIQRPLPHNLPPQPNTFVGRVREMNQLVAHLDNPDCRLLTLAGPGGIGKTRLAIEGAKRYVEADQAFGGATFSDGIYFVDLAPVPLTETTEGAASRLSQVSHLWSCAIADVLDFTFQGSTDQLTQLHRHVREKEMLLVLDNFEHLIDGASLLADLLQQARYIKLLVTSRERLNLMEEWVIELDGLDFPEEEGKIGDVVDWSQPQKLAAQPPDQPETGFQSLISNIDSYSAIALFVQQASQIRGDFNFSETEIPYLIRICQLVEGSPLALVLAASLLRVLTCTEIVQGIEQSLDFLAASQRNIPERHRRLRAVFEQSWQMLSDQEQAVLRKLSIFRGGFRREAVQEVAGATLSTLTGLVDKSLLRLTDSGRYEIHELLRQFATEKLAQTRVEQEATQDAHCRYYAKLLQEQAPLLDSIERQAAMVIINPEIDNIRVGWQNTLRQGRSVMVSEINQFVLGIGIYFSRRGRLREGAGMTRRALKRLEEEGAPTVHRAGRESRLAYGQLLVIHGLCLQQLGELSSASTCHSKGITILHSLEERYYTLVLGLSLLGIISIQQGNYTEAKSHLMESIALATTMGDQRSEAKSLTFLGVAAIGLGEYAEAERLLNNVWPILRDLGETWYTSVALGNLAQAKNVMNKPVLEIKLTLQKSLELARSMGESWVVPHTLYYLAHTLKLIDSEEVLRYQEILQEGVKLSREVGDQWCLATILTELGYTYNSLGEETKAKGCLNEALEIGIKMLAFPVILDCFVGLAMISGKHDTGSLARQEQAIVLLTLALNHSASTRRTQNKATQVLAELQDAGLPSQIVKAAKERGHTITLEAMAEEILSESNENI